MIIQAPLDFFSLNESESSREGDKSLILSKLFIRFS